MTQNMIQVGTKWALDMTKKGSKGELRFLFCLVIDKAPFVNVFIKSSLTSGKRGDRYCKGRGGRRKLFLPECRGIDLVSSSISTRRNDRHFLLVHRCGVGVGSSHHGARKGAQLELKSHLATPYRHHTARLSDTPTMLLGTFRTDGTHNKTGKKKNEMKKKKERWYPRPSPDTDLAIKERAFWHLRGSRSAT